MGRPLTRTRTTELGNVTLTDFDLGDLYPEMVFARILDSILPSTMLTPPEPSWGERAIGLLGTLLVVGATAAAKRAGPPMTTWPAEPPPATSTRTRRWRGRFARPVARVEPVAAIEAAPRTETQEVVAVLAAARAAVSTEEARSRFLTALVARLYSEEQRRVIREALIGGADGLLRLNTMVQALTTDRLRSAVTGLLEENPSIVDDKSRAELRRVLETGRGRSSSSDPLRSAGDVLTAGGRLSPGDKLTSRNGRYALVMQTDGNLVGYDGTQAFWDTGTWGQPGNYLVGEPNGRFTVLTPVGTVAWSQESGSPAGYLSIQDDRNVVIYVSRGPNSPAAWASHTWI